MDQLSSESSLDTLSDFFIIDEILSRVDSAKTIVRLGMASKRFHSLCSYPSVVQFKEVQYEIGFIKYLDKFFYYRMNANFNYDFRRFLMCLSKKMDRSTLFNFVTICLLRWFHKALSLNVEELILRFNGNPIGYYDGKLRRPELNLQYSMIPLKHLRVLALRDIPFSLNQSFGDWISTYCVSLEELNLSDVLVLPTTLTIKSFSLRVFSIEGDFKELHVVSAPKLETLIVTWSLLNPDRYESHPFINISDTPNLKSFYLKNSDASYNSLRYGSSGDTNKFPSLKYAGVLLEEASLISSSTLLHDISQTRVLCVSYAILHQISQEGKRKYYANLFRMLYKLHVRAEEYKWWENADAIMSFAKSIPSLKIFKLSIVDDYGFQTSLEWLQNALSLNVEELELRFTDNYNYLDVPELKFQYSNPLNHLRVLTLKDIPIGLSHSFEDWVSTCCLNLQELNLSGVLVIPGNLRITSSSLRAFTIDAHFTDLHVSAPKLVTLHVKWNLTYHGTHEKNLSLKVSDSPDLEELLLNVHKSLPFEYYNCSGDHKSSFPSLRSATVLVPEITYNNNISLDSLKRLLHDISHTRKLFVSGAILHMISRRGIIHSMNSIHTLEKLHVRVDEINNTAQSIMSFVKKAPLLKNLQLTIKKAAHDPPISKKFRESLVDNILKLGISRPIIFLDDYKVKIEVGPGDDETLLLQRIIMNAPRNFKFFFSYQR